MKRKHSIIFGIVITAAIYFYLIPLETEFVSSRKTDDIEFIQETGINDVKIQNYDSNIKYILLWTRHDYAPFYFFKNGQESFIKNNCRFTNCHVTSNRKYFKRVTKFHAVAFNGRTMNAKHLPKQRSPHQKYIYFNMEAADNFPICDKEFDKFFNWTATYKLNSDILFPYIAIKNNQGDIIGPRLNMSWPNVLLAVNGNYSAKLKSKSKAAAWFVSNCRSRSGRGKFVEKLQKALQIYGLHVDIYGSCGPLKCPRSKNDMCDSLVEQDYYFYLSLENSFSDDYVTEKLLTALQHDAVPIVYGGADYTKFLPPGSYINARELDVNTLAATMNELIKNPDQYKNYFRWKSQYSYVDASRSDNVCAVCASLNEDRFSKMSSYEQFRKWWNPEYEDRCRLATRLRNILK